MAAAQQIYAPVWLQHAWRNRLQTRSLLNAVSLTGDPDGLARALAKTEPVQRGWLERIFLSGRRRPELSLLRTHPETQAPIARLMALFSIMARVQTN